MSNAIADGEENAPVALRIVDDEAADEEEEEQEDEDGFYLAPKACRHCRRRRVRCCRTIPVCRNCTRREEQCDLSKYETKERIAKAAEPKEDEVDELETSEVLGEAVATAAGGQDIPVSDHPPLPTTFSPSSSLAHLLTFPSLTPSLDLALTRDSIHPAPSPDLAQLLCAPTRPFPPPPPPPGHLSPLYEDGENGQTEERASQSPLAPRFERVEVYGNSLGGTRETREALCMVILFGAEAPLENVQLARVDVQGLYNELLSCDALYPSSPTLLSPFSLSPPATSIAPLALAPSQARACLAAYFRLVEPSLSLYPSRDSQVRFQETCLRIWNTTPCSGVNGDGDAHEAKPKGWWSMYLATVALGMMVLSEGEALQIGIPVEEEERAGWAREVAEEAVKGLGRDAFTAVPTVEGLRAALLLLSFDLGGLSSKPNVSSVLAALPTVVAAAYELGLNREPGHKVGEEEKEERRGLWWRVFELEATLLFTNKFSNLLNSPHILTPLDLVPLVYQYEQLPGQREDGEVVEELVRKAQGMRLRAVRDEAGERASDEEEKRWEELAYDILNFPPALIMQIDRFQQLLAVSTFLQAVALIALRSQVYPSLPSAAVLVPHLVSLTSALKTSSWALHLHQTVHRAVLLLEHLVPPSTPFASWTTNGISAVGGYA
ncbi:hypothetical protein JCM11251_003939 [Rhodosporidiobolus azoricus]